MKEIKLSKTQTIGLNMIQTEAAKAVNEFLAEVIKEANEDLNLKWRFDPPTGSLKADE
jgi:hypothetical protein